MSEATFKQHLNQLKDILGLLQGDIETGTVSQANQWYDQITDTVLNALDSMEDILNPRMGFDADSLADEDVVEEDDMEAMEAEDLENEAVEELENADELEEVETEDEDEDMDQDEENSARVLTININLRNR